jgi:DNA-directed RNA polymerase subunit RPC12/RpoP
MNEEEKRMKVIKHNAKRQGYFIKMIISLIMIFVFIYLEPKSDLMFVLCFVMMLICGMAAMCFKALHQGMLYCPLCGTSFGYGSWLSGTMPTRCPHCGENLYYR